MGVRGLIGALLAGMALAGCGSSEEYEIEPGEGLPVACVARTQSIGCRSSGGKFYYDYGSNRCRPAFTGDCAGRTLFDTKEKCVRYCGALP